MKSTISRKKTILKSRLGESTKSTTKQHKTMNWPNILANGLQYGVGDTWYSMIKSPGIMCVSVLANMYNVRLYISKYFLLTYKYMYPVSIYLMNNLLPSQKQLCSKQMNKQTAATSCAVTSSHSVNSSNMLTSQVKYKVISQSHQRF